jgi:DNA polymerase III sliding clamp (beta) subunit (PCNA family)
MKITLNKNEILNILKTFAKQAKYAPEIEKNTFFELQNNILTLKNSNFDTIICAKILLKLENEKNFNFTLNTKNFEKIIKQVKDDDFDMLINQDDINVNGCCLEKITNQDHQEVSDSLQDKNINFTLSIKANLFIETIKQALAHVGDDGREHLSGVGIDAKNNNLNIVGTSGSALYKSTINSDLQKITTSSNYDGKVFILPKELCKQIINAKNILQDDLIRIEFFNNSLNLDHFKIKIIGRFISADFPPYDKLFLKNTNFNFKINLQNLIDAVKMASKIDNDLKNNDIILKIDGYKLIVTKKKQDKILFNMPINILENNVGDDFSMCFNNTLLLKILETYKIFNNNNEVVIKLSKYVPFNQKINKLFDPIFLENKKENQDCNLILMPIRH